MYSPISHIRLATSNTNPITTVIQGGTFGYSSSNPQNGNAIEASTFKREVPSIAVAIEKARSECRRSNMSDVMAKHFASMIEANPSTTRPQDLRDSIVNYLGTKGFNDQAVLEGVRSAERMHTFGLPYNARCDLLAMLQRSYNAFVAGIKKTASFRSNFAHPEGLLEIKKAADRYDAVHHDLSTIPLESMHAFYTALFPFVSEDMRKIVWPMLFGKPGYVQRLRDDAVLYEGEPGPALDARFKHPAGDDNDDEAPNAKRMALGRAGPAGGATPMVPMGPWVGQGHGFSQGSSSTSSSFSGIPPFPWGPPDGRAATATDSHSTASAGGLGSSAMVPPWLLSAPHQPLVWGNVVRGSGEEVPSWPASLIVNPGATTALQPIPMLLGPVVDQMPSQAPPTGRDVMPPPEPLPAASSVPFEPFDNLKMLAEVAAQRLPAPLLIPTQSEWPGDLQFGLQQGLTPLPVTVDEDSVSMPMPDRVLPQVTGSHPQNPTT